MHFLTSCNQCFECNVSWKVLEKGFECLYEPCVWFDELVTDCNVNVVFIRISLVDSVHCMELQIALLMRT